MRRVTVVLCLLAASLSARAGVNEWTPIGPDGTAARAIAAHPSAPGLFFGVAAGAIYRTADYGQTWAVVRESLHDRLTRIAIDPSNPSIMLVTTDTNELFRSTDAGATFDKIIVPGRFAKVVYPGDGSALAAAADGRIYVSTNFGTTWQIRYAGFGGAPYDIVAAPQDPSTLYAGYGPSLWKSTDSGSTWISVNQLGGIEPRSIAVDPGNSAHLLIAMLGSGLVECQNGGASCILVDPRGYAWAGFHPSRAGAHVGAAVAIPTRGRVVRRAGLGDPWIEGQALSLLDVGGAAFSPHDLDLDGSTLIAATTEGWLFTDNGGATFSGRTAGIRNLTVSDVASANDGAVYAAYTTGPVGILRRTASGWDAVNNAALKAAFPRGITSLRLGVDVTNSATLLAATGRDVARSFDGGQSWSLAHAQLPQSGISELDTPSVLRFDPFDSRVVFAGLQAQVPYRSGDQGDTWTVVAGLERDTRAIEFDPSVPGTIYVSTGGTTAMDPVMKSVNGGQSWLPADIGLGFGATAALAVAPSNNRVLYKGGGYRSTDASASWQVVSNFGVDRLVIDPTVESTLFGTARGAAYRSVDGGKTWEELKAGPADLAVDRLVVDPLKPNSVIATAAKYGLVELTVAPDLEATLQPAALAVATGGTASATVRVTNRGPLAASAVKVSVSAPAGATLSAAPAGACITVGSGLECSLGGVLANQQADLLVTLSGAAGLSGTLTASVTGHEPDPSAGNNSATATVASTPAGSSGGSSGGGGGGAESALTTLALLAVLVLKLAVLNLPIRRAARDRGCCPGTGSRRARQSR